MKRYELEYVRFRDHYIYISEDASEFTQLVASDFEIRPQEFGIAGWTIGENEEYMVIVPVMPVIEGSKVVSRAYFHAWFIHKGSIIKRCKLRIYEEKKKGKE